MQDEELIQSVLRGQGWFYAEIVERYQTKLYRTAYYYCRTPEDARDITQEIFIKAYNSLQGFKGGSSFCTWLFRIAVNHCIDWTRKHKSRNHEIGGMADPQSVEDSPETLFMRQETAVEVQEAVRSLPQIYSAVLILYYFEDFSPHEIAEILAASKRTVETRLFRGRKLLREIISPRLNGGEGNELPTRPGRLAQLR